VVVKDAKMDAFMGFPVVADGKSVLQRFFELPLEKHSSRHQFQRKRCASMAVAFWNLPAATGNRQRLLRR
jgi:hypothetical protein